MMKNVGFNIGLFVFFYVVWLWLFSSLRLSGVALLIVALIGWVGELGT